MERRRFLKQAAVTTAGLTCADFLGFFSRFGAPFDDRAFAMADDKSAEADNPHFLIYYFIEGGWEGYDMFNVIDTPNNVIHRLKNITDERYRVLHWKEANYGIYQTGNLRYGYLAEHGKSLFPHMAVLSSMHTGAFHSGERLNAHMGHYTYAIDADRQDDERSVMQAFAEVYGQPYVLPNLSWHYWLADGELNAVQYTGRKGYYADLGPPQAHTIYAGTPAKLRQFLLHMQAASNDTVNRQVQGFLDNLPYHLASDSDSEVVKTYNSARHVYENLIKNGMRLDRTMLGRLFSDPVLRAKFNVQPADELITYQSVNGNKARTKFSPATNVQAMMTYELLRAGLGCTFWIESRNIRQFDSHFSRQGLWGPDRRTPRGEPDQTAMMNEQLWGPLTTLVELLQATQYKQTGTSLFDHATIVITSEFGRTINGDVDSIEKLSVPAEDKQKMIDGQDVSQHWKVTSAAFLGGKVKGNTQYGGVGEQTMMAVPLLPDGTTDPAYDPVTGNAKPGRTPNPKASVPDHGDVYATALYLSDINPKGHGRNERPPLTYIKKA